MRTDQSVQHNPYARSWRLSWPMPKRGVTIPFDVAEEDRRRNTLRGNGIFPPPSDTTGND